MNRKKHAAIVLLMAFVFGFTIILASFRYHTAAASVQQTASGDDAAAADPQEQEEQQQTETETAETETEEPVPEGLVKEKDGKLYFYENGKAVRRTLKEINGRTYYFGSSGSALMNRWKTVHGEKYYFGSKGKAYRGARKIEGRYYVFRADGRLGTGKDNHVVKYEDKRYFVTKKGRAISGWQIYDNKVLYAASSGRMAANKKVSYIEFNKKGYAVNRYQGMAKIYAASFIRKHTAKYMSKMTKLRTCFYYMLRNRRYIAHYVKDKRAYTTNTWQYKAAADMLCDRRLEGNCRNFAAALRRLPKNWAINLMYGA